MGTTTKQVQLSRRTVAVSDVEPAIDGPRRRLLVVALASTAIFLDQIATPAFAVVQPHLAGAFAFGPDEAAWWTLLLRARRR